MRSTREEWVRIQRQRGVDQIQRTRMWMLALAHAFGALTTVSASKATGLLSDVAARRLRELWREGHLSRHRRLGNKQGGAFQIYTLTDSGRALLVDRTAMLIVQSRREA